MSDEHILISFFQNSFVINKNLKNPDLLKLRLVPLHSYQYIKLLLKFIQVLKSKITFLIFFTFARLKILLSTILIFIL